MTTQMSNNRLSGCPKCVSGRVFTDTFDGDLYCINCGWRQNRPSTSVTIPRKIKATSARMPRLREARTRSGSTSEEKELLELFRELFG